MLLSDMHVVSFNMIKASKYVQVWCQKSVTPRGVGWLSCWQHGVLRDVAVWCVCDGNKFGCLPAVKRVCQASNEDLCGFVGGNSVGRFCAHKGQGRCVGLSICLCRAWWSRE